MISLGGPERLLVGIDRLDYTKGIPRRLLAYERLLAEHPELHGHVRLVQVAVPSRTHVDAYADLRAQVDQMVGRINGRFGTPTWAPLHYLYRNLCDNEVVALYRAADALLVTPGPRRDEPRRQGVRRRALRRRRRPGAERVRRRGGRAGRGGARQPLRRRAHRRGLPRAR